MAEIIDAETVAELRAEWTKNLHDIISGGPRDITIQFKLAGEILRTIEALGKENAHLKITRRSLQKECAGLAANCRRWAVKVNKLETQGEKSEAVARAAKEAHARYRDPYTTSIRTHAAMLQVEKALAAWEAKP